MTEDRGVPDIKLTKRNDKRTMRVQRGYRCDYWY